MWPGFGQNMRVLQWVVERCRGRAHAVDSAVGLVPDFADLNWTGTEFGAQRFATVMRVQADEWRRELASHDELFAKLGTKRPPALQAERDQLAQRLAP